MQAVRRSLLAGVIATLTVAGCDDGDPTRPDGNVGTHVDDWRDRAIYQVVIDRFDNAVLENDVIDGVQTIPGALERHQGGDLRGVTRRLDYIAGLGMSAM